MAESFSSEAFVLSYQIFDALKPNQVDYPHTVRKVSYQPPLPSFTRRFKA